MYVETINPVIEIKESKIAYISFDDGPSNVTPKILDTLKKYDIKATFFQEGYSAIADIVFMILFSISLVILLLIAISFKFKKD